MNPKFVSFFPLVPDSRLIKFRALKQWIDEIHEHCPGVKVCLVALKCDLREDPIARERVAKYGDEMVEYEQVCSPSIISGYV